MKSPDDNDAEWLAYISLKRIKSPKIATYIIKKFNLYRDISYWDDVEFDHYGGKDNFIRMLNVLRASEDNELSNLANKYLKKYG